MPFQMRRRQQRKITYLIIENKLKYSKRSEIKRSYIRKHGNLHDTCETLSHYEKVRAYCSWYDVQISYRTSHTDTEYRRCV